MDSVMAADAKPLLGPMQPLLGLPEDIQFSEMSGARDNKTNKGRISRSTRGIFYENLDRGLEMKLPASSQARRIRWLIDTARISRTHAQRWLPENRNKVDIALWQAPSIDTLFFVAEAFNVTPAEFLTQGCKLDERKKRSADDLSHDGQQSGRQELLQRPPGGKDTQR